MKVTGTSYGLERAALNKWRKERHPHIVELLASYNFKGSQHLVFPWAEGNLRQYWEQRSISSQAETRLDTTYWIAQQVLGLTSALKYIHNPSFIQGERQYGRHGDIKPENILWYKSPADPRGTLVIADLGLTSMHKKYEDQPRNSQCTPTYRPPEFDLSERWSSSYDIWSFGCVLSEMATWYLLDRNAVEHQFPAVRTTVMDTSSIEALREDDSFFAVERKDRAKTAMVKQPVTKWLRMLRDQPECTGFFHELLDLIEHRMLLVNPEDRIDARTLVSELERTTAKLQKFGLFRNQSMLQTYGLAPGRKIILSPTADSLEEQETIDKEIVCGSPDMPDISNQRLVEEVGSLSLFDSLRMRIEDFLGDDIDWSPLPPLGPFGLSPHTKLVWKYGNREMSIALNQEEVERWKNKSRHHSQSILPVTQSNRTSASNYTINDRINYAWSCLSHLPGKMSKVWFWNPSKVYGTSATKSESDPGGQSSKESYLCVDRCWTSIPETKMNTIDTIDTMADDAEFFRKARAVLSSARGNWIQRFLSWRSYTQVRLSKFHFLFDDIDLVAMDFGAISKSNANSICHGYDYRCQPALEVDIHMRMIAEIILHGIKNPQYGCGKRTVLDGIPKLNSPPGLRKRALSSGWGFHAGQGLSLKKVFTWITAILAFGLSFVPIWLCSISNVDLQNAFAPVTFLATLVTIILAMAAISHSM